MHGGMGLGTRESVFRTMLLCREKKKENHSSFEDKS